MIGPRFGSTILGRAATLLGICILCVLGGLALRGSPAAAQRPAGAPLSSATPTATSTATPTCVPVPLYPHYDDVPPVLDGLQLTANQPPPATFQLF
ncbi:MAG TPA: hypothetical protein VKY74_03185, partial [Chloroflexia bacterium]|nr:hypothetical protein [Chloroflexia bacterium]